MTPMQLINARKQFGLSQKELAGLLGVSREHISRMENGHETISRLTECAVKYVLFDIGIYHTPQING